MREDNHLLTVRHHMNNEFILIILKNDSQNLERLPIVP